MLLLLPKLSALPGSQQEPTAQLLTAINRVGPLPGMNGNYP